MNYEKKYKETLERARIWQEHLNESGDKDYAEELSYIFPKLKKSEDEKIRKALIRFHKSTIKVDGIKGEDIITWLEKQGEQKTADEVEPKFHEGEWITNGDYTWKIVEVKPLDYILQSQDGNIVDDTISHVDEHFHSFTIQDAKEGDVLYAKGFYGDCVFIFNGLDKWKFDEPSGDRAVATGHCCITISSKNIEFVIQGPDCVEVDTVSPATKEQRDTLFAKMKEAGYTFDFEKKELKKIENEIEIPFGAKDSELQQATYYIPKGFYAEIKDDKVVIKKGEKLTAWSEDDEHRVKDAIYFLDTAKKHYASAVELDACIDWIKSLEDRVQPKQEWSAEDNSVLKDIKVAVASYWDEDTENIILDWLKSLKQRIGG